MAASIHIAPEKVTQDGGSLESTPLDSLLRPCAVLGVLRTCDVAVDGQSIPPTGPRRSQRSRMPSGRFARLSAQGTQRFADAGSGRRSVPAQRGAACPGGGLGKRGALMEYGGRIRRDEAERLAWACIQSARDISVVLHHAAPPMRRWWRCGKARHEAATAA